MEKREYRFGEIRAIPKDVEETRTISFVVSDATKDRHNSILNPKGWDLKNYKKNPIVAFQHQIYGGFLTDANPDNVIGTSKVTKEDDKLVADIKFEPEEINPLAEKIFRKVIHGTLRSTSVGFYPIKSHEGDKEKGEEEGVKYYDSMELLEISITPLPSNPNAVKRASEEEKIELITYILNEALGDKFNEKLTIKGITSILRGEEKEPEKKEPMGIEL